LFPEQQILKLFDSYLIKHENVVAAFELCSENDFHLCVQAWQTIECVYMKLQGVLWRWSQAPVSYW